MQLDAVGENSVDVRLETAVRRGAFCVMRCLWKLSGT
jgi:hypothetical protein